jgi:hypothetical protein
MGPLGYLLWAHDSVSRWRQVKAGVVPDSEVMRIVRPLVSASCSKMSLSFERMGALGRGSLHQPTASRLALRENNNCLMSAAGLAGLNR